MQHKEAVKQRKLLHAGGASPWLMQCGMQTHFIMSMDDSCTLKARGVIVTTKAGGVIVTA